MNSLRNSKVFSLFGAFFLLLICLSSAVPGNSLAQTSSGAQDLRISTVAKGNFQLFSATPSQTLSSNGNWFYTFSWTRKIAARNGYILVSQLQSDNKYHVVARFPTNLSTQTLPGIGTVTTGADFAPGKSYRLSYYSKPYAPHTTDYVILRSIFVTPAAPAQVSAPITITSPSAGQQWTMGSIKTISWNPPSGVSKVDISLAKLVNLGLSCTQTSCPTGWQPIGTIAQNVNNSGNFSWVVGETSRGSATAGEYRVTIGPPGATPTYSSTFNITSASTNQIIMVTNPPVSQTIPQWQIGTSKNITWTPPSGQSTVTIQVVERLMTDCYYNPNSTDPYQCDLPNGGTLTIPNVPNSGSYAWTVAAIPQTINSNGQFAIRIFAGDWSGISGSFYITSASTGSGSTTIRVGQLVALNQIIYYVASNGLYKVPANVLTSWGWNSSILVANSAEAALTIRGEIPPRDPACSNPIDQINLLCGTTSGGSTPTNFALSVTVTGSGSVTCAIGTASAVTCPVSSSVLAGKTIVLTASPSTRFISWSGSVCSSSGTTCTFTMPSAPVSLGANFSASTGGTTFIPAELISPTVFTNTSGTETFTWNDVAAAGNVNSSGQSVGGKYWLQVGTGRGLGDLSSGLTLDATSKQVTGLPKDGVTQIYVRLWTHEKAKVDPGDNSTWTSYKDYTFIAANGSTGGNGGNTGGNNTGFVKATMTLPAQLPGSSYNFTWGGAVGGDGKYWLQIANNPDQRDTGTDNQNTGILSSGDVVVNLTHKQVNGLPTDGRTLYVRLWTHSATTDWSNNYVDYQVKASGTGGTGGNTGGDPTISFKVNGGSSANLTFGNGVQYSWTTTNAKYVQVKLSSVIDNGYQLHPEAVNSSDINACTQFPYWLMPGGYSLALNLPANHNLPANGNYDSLVNGGIEYIPSTGQTLTSAIGSPGILQQLHSCVLPRTFTVTATAVKNNSCQDGPCSTATVTMRMPAAGKFSDLWLPANLGAGNPWYRYLGSDTPNGSWANVEPGGWAVFPVYISSYVSPITAQISLAPLPATIFSYFGVDFNGLGDLTGITYTPDANPTIINQPTGANSKVKIGSLRINMNISLRYPVAFQLKTQVGSDVKTSYILVTDPREYQATTLEGAAKPSSSSYNYPAQ